MQPGQRKSSGVPSTFTPLGHQLLGAEQGSEAAGETGLASHFHCKTSYLPSSLPAFPCSFYLGILFQLFLFYCEHPSTLYVGEGLGATAAFKDWARVWDGCSARGHPGRAAEREQLGASRRSPANAGAVSGTGAEPILEGGVQQESEVAAGGSGGTRDRWRRLRGSGPTARGRGRTPPGAAGPVPLQAPQPRGAAPRAPHRGDNTFAYPPRLYLHNRTSKHLHSHAPLLSLCGGHRPIPRSDWRSPSPRPAPYISRAAGWLPRSAVSAGVGTGSSLLSLLPPP